MRVYHLCHHFGVVEHALIAGAFLGVCHCGHGGRDLLALLLGVDVILALGVLAVFVADVLVVLVDLVVATLVFETAIRDVTML